MKRQLLTYLIFSASLLLAGFAEAQNNHKDEVRLAERFLAEGRYLEAGERYAAAYGAKTSKTEYANLAGEQFYLIKDYARASDYFKIVARDWSSYPLAGLKYARSLKQSKRYSQATKAYLDFLEIYEGDDREIIKKLVELEVKGTEMARQSAENFNTSTAVDQLGEGVNSLKNELAPMPLADRTVYYLSDANGYMRMFRSNLEGEQWTKGELATQFPIIPGKHIGSGSLGPMGDRFYFSLCDASAFMGQPTAPCEIVVIVKEGDEWGKPESLPTYVNTPGNSTSHPFVYQDGELEVMLFSSDRLDGYGGMDLYRSERYLTSEATDFSFPENLGPVVNSVGDEVTPFYVLESQTLYFSSNGYINMGGYDIFKTRGNGQAWNAPENLKAPINSSADDYYYRQAPSSNLAFFSSNRALEGKKSRTSNEDIFTVRAGAPTISVTVQVVDSANSRPLRNVALAVYTKIPGATRRLVTSKMSEDGYFSLKLPMDADLDFDVQALDYRRRVQLVATPAEKKSSLQLPPLRMARIRLPLVDAQRIEAERTEAPVAVIPSKPMPVEEAPSSAVQLTPKPASTTQAPTPTEPSPLPTGSVSVNREETTKLANPAVSPTDGQVRNPTSEIRNTKTETTTSANPAVSPTDGQVRNPTSEVPSTKTEITTPANPAVSPTDGQVRNPTSEVPSTRTETTTSANPAVSPTDGQVRNPTSEIRNTKTETTTSVNTKVSPTDGQVRNPKSEIRNTKTETTTSANTKVSPTDGQVRNPTSEIRNTKTEITTPANSTVSRTDGQVRNPTSEIRNTKTETTTSANPAVSPTDGQVRNPTSEIRNTKTETTTSANLAVSPTDGQVRNPTSEIRNTKTETTTPANSTMSRTDGQVRNPTSEIRNTKTETTTPASPAVSRKDVEVAPPKSNSTVVRPPAAQRSSIVPLAREYRIQIEARRAFDPAHRRYNQVSEIGAVSSNYIEAKDLHRVLIGSYLSLEEAQRALNRVKNAGWKDAFVALFRNGQYKGLAVR